MGISLGATTVILLIIASLVAARLARIFLDQKTNLLKAALEMTNETVFSFEAKTNRWVSLRQDNLSFLGYSDEVPEKIMALIKSESLRCIGQKANDVFPTVKIKVPAKAGEMKNIRIKVKEFISKASDGNIYLVLLSDVTQQIQHEESREQDKLQMVQMEKYAVLRDLGAGVAHEINNPLAIILGRAQTLKIKLSRGAMSPEAVIDTLDKIETNVKRISKIVQALRLMTKDSSNEESENISVVSLFEDLASVWAERLKNKGFEFKLPSVDPYLEVFGKRSLLITALFNLVSNSFEANQDIDTRWIHIDSQVSNDQLVISVCDSGRGIPEDARQRIFDPFFTTRDAAKSSGLGLSVAKGIFEVHKGSLEYDSASKNTKFIVRMPLTPRRDQRAA